MSVKSHAEELVGQESIQLALQMDLFFCSLNVNERLSLYEISCKRVRHGIVSKCLSAPLFFGRFATNEAPHGLIERRATPMTVS